MDGLRTRNVGFRVLSGQGAQIDTTTPNRCLVFGLFATLEKFARELSAGLVAVRARVRLGGRPRKMHATTLRMAMSAMADQKSVASEVAKRLISPLLRFIRMSIAIDLVKEAGLKLLNS